MTPIATFRSRQIPDLYCPPSTKSAVAQTVNRTKMFHAKRFGTIEPRNANITDFCSAWSGSLGATARAAGKKPSRPWGDKGGRSRYQFRADWLGLDRRG